MLFSASLLNGAMTTQSQQQGVFAQIVNVFVLLLAFILLILEFLLIFYTITVAFECSKPGPERIVHVTLAILVPIPYMLLSIFWSPCAQKRLRGE